METSSAWASRQMVPAPDRSRCCSICEMIDLATPDCIDISASERPYPLRSLRTVMRPNRLESAAAPASNNLGLVLALDAHVGDPLAMFRRLTPAAESNGSSCSGLVPRLSGSILLAPAHGVDLSFPEFGDLLGHEKDQRRAPYEYGLPRRFETASLVCL